MHLLYLPHSIFYARSLAVGRERGTGGGRELLYTEEAKFRGLLSRLLRGFWDTHTTTDFYFTDPLLLVGDAGGDVHGG